MVSVLKGEGVSVKELGIIRRAQIRGTTSINVECLDSLPDEQKNLYTILDEEIEKKRNQFIQEIPTLSFQDLSQTKLENYYKKKTWDQIFTSNPDILEIVASKSKVNNEAVLNSILLLRPIEWRAITWMLEYVKKTNELRRQRLAYALLDMLSVSTAEDARKREQDELKERFAKEERRQFSAKGGNKKRENDKNGSQKDKEFVRQCWEKWQDNKHQYKSKAQFARAMLDKIEILTSTKVIEKFCLTWERERTKK